MKQLVPTAALCLVACVSCGDASGPTLRSAPAALQVANVDETASTSARPIERRLIRTGDLVIHVAEIEATMSATANIATANGGFISDRQVQRNENGRSHASVTLKVPSAQFTAVLSELKLLGQVKHESTETEDVTKAYFDLETRLRIKRSMEERLRGILRERTGNVSEILEVERELGRVVGQIEQLEGERRYYDHQVDISTIVLRLHEQEATIATTGFFTSLAEGFRESVRVLGRSISRLIYLLVVLVPWVVPVALLWWLGRIANKRLRMRHKGDAV